jgi:formate hydrogenlyase subunit 4
MADRIANLPPSQQQPSDIDVNVMREVFGDGVAVAKSLQLKKLIIPAILFVVLSLPMVDNLLKNVVPDSKMVIMFVKTLIFLIILVVLQLVSG